MDRNLEQLFARCEQAIAESRRLISQNTQSLDECRAWMRPLQQHQKQMAAAIRKTEERLRLLKSDLLSE